MWDKLKAKERGRNGLSLRDLKFTTLIYHCTSGCGLGYNDISMQVFVLGFKITLKLYVELKQFRSRDVLKCRRVLIIPCENTKDESVLPNPSCIPSNAVGKSGKGRKMPGASEDGSSMHWLSEVFALLASS